MAESQPVLLAWVLEGPALRHVSTWAQLAPDARPLVRCPVCNDAVTLKLGARQAHHAAHRAESTCPVQWWETALHLNTKHHLASALRGAEQVTVRHLCAHRFGVLGETIMTPGMVPCTAVRDEPFARDWDDVRVEAGLSGTRPDVLLLRRGNPVALIEVRRTNAVTAEKIERLAALGVPWCEVAASRTLYAELTSWAPDAPLIVARTDRRAIWWCDAHQPSTRRRRRDALTDRPWAARVVDRYLDRGRMVRDIVFVTGEHSGARVRTPTLRHRASDDVLASLEAGLRRRVLREAHEAFLAWARERRAAGERLDSPMSWAPADSLRADGDRWVAGTTLYPQRWRWDGARGRWVRDDHVGTVQWVHAIRHKDAGA